jgi:hypothetical protein
MSIPIVARQGLGKNINAVTNTRNNRIVGRIVSYAVRVYQRRVCWPVYPKVRITLRLAVYCQSVRLGAKSLRLTTGVFLLQLNLCGHSPYVISFLTRGWVCLLSLLINGLLNTFPLQRRIVGGDISYAFHVVSKESK